MTTGSGFTRDGLCHDVEVEIDGTNLEDLTSELENVALSSEETALLLRHLHDRIVGHFGAEFFDVWQAKWGLHRHGAEELAMLAIAKLAPVLNTLPAGTVTSLAEQELIAAPITFPWEDRY